MEEDFRIISQFSPFMQSKYKKIKDKIIGTFVHELKRSTYFEVDFKSALSKCIDGLGNRKIEQILCYGLGSFRNGVDIASRYQLALLLLLYECLLERGQPLSTVVEIYDPLFDDVDSGTLSTFSNPRFKLITENEYCARKLVTSDENRCVLIYMPHLDKYLYNNLLGANWSAENLNRMVVLGNSFHEMTEAPSIQKAELHYMRQLVGNFEKQSKASTRKGKTNNKSENRRRMAKNSEGLVEFEIDDSSFEHWNIFNSLSFHLIDIAWLKANSTEIKQLPNWIRVTTIPADGWPD